MRGRVIERALIRSSQLVDGNGDKKGEHSPFAFARIARERPRRTGRGRYLNIRPRRDLSAVDAGLLCWLAD